jgi:hypothetical protein
LPLAAIPLVLHLLTLHRLKTVELSTFRFLFDSYVQQRRRMQFLEALLAMLRTAFLLALVFMVGRPVIKNWNSLFGATGGTGGREVILLVDCSASMNAAYAGVPAIERARSAARSVAERLGRDDRLTLVRVGATPEEVFSRFSTDAREIQDQIDGLKTTSSRANVFAALLQLFGPESARRSNPLVYLFTDCQASGWKEVRNQGLDRLVPAGTPFVVVNVGPKEPLPNVAVVGDAPRMNRAIAGLPFGLQARVVNYSKNQPAEVVLSLVIDGEMVGKPLPLTLKPGETVTRKIDFTPNKPGILRGELAITARAADRFPDDDAYFFTLNVEPRVRVLLVNGNPAPDPLDNEARYLLTALTSRAEAAPAEGKPEVARSSKEILRSLDVREVPEPALTPDLLKDASVVVLANCGSLNAPQFEALRGFVSGGGGLLLFPGDRVQPDLYNSQFFPVPGPQGQRLTPVTLGPAEGDPEKLETFEPLAALDFTHPALSVFDDPDPDVRHFKTVRVYKRFKLQMPPRKAGEKGTGWVLARFGNGAPALVESRLGDGTVVLAAFPAHPRWTNLPTKPDFVPLVLRLVAHAEHRPEADVSPVVPAGGAAEITAGLAWDRAEATITWKEEGERKKATSHTATRRLERTGPRLAATFEQTSARGWYGVDLRSEQRAQARSAQLAFAVNLAPEESDFTLVGESEVRKLLPGAQLTFIDASAEAQQEKGALGNEKEVWPLLIWVVFAIIGIEFLLATTSGRRADPEEQVGVAERIARLSPGSWVGRMTGGGRKDAGGGTAGE